MILSEDGLKLIESFEGFRPQVYSDLAGHPSIGYGHKLLPGESYPSGITQDEAQALLARDIQWAEKIVNSLVKVPLSQGQFDALVSFTFNNGGGTFAKSSILPELNAGKFMEANWEIGRYYFADGKPSTGLLRRRHAEQAMFSGLPVGQLEEA